MTLELILMRHAKSSWEDPTLEDIDRPLNGRGRRAAASLGRWLKESGNLPATVLVSPARRTTETLKGLRPYLQDNVRVVEKTQLYEAESADILAVLRQSEAESPVLLIGHNPGIGALAEQLAEHAPNHPAFHRYPTGATLVLRFDTEPWSELHSGSGHVIDFVVPGELPAPSD